MSASYRIDANQLLERQNSTEPASEPSAFARRWGQWAHQHRDTFLSLPGNLVFRNVAKVLASVIPTALSFTATRYAFKAYNEAEHLSEGINKPLKMLTKNQLFQQTAFIFGGFTIFRACCKLWQRNYDRIFNHSDNPAESIEAIDNLPSNIIRDVKEILPPEVAGTAISAFPLAAVKMGFKCKEATLEGNLTQAKKGFVNDWLASVPAYAVFFEANDRLYDDFSKGKDSPDYYDLLCCAPEKPDQGPSKSKWRMLSEDGLGKVAFRRVGSLLLGIAPFIGLQRLSRATIGEVVPGKNSFMNNFLKEYAAYAGFATYTVTSELYTKAYDELLKKLEARHREKTPS